MKSKATARFWSAYRALPDDVKKQARQAYRQFEANPAHPGLQFKKVHSTEPVYSARVTRDCRAVGLLQGGTVTWFWIGDHADYDRLLAHRHRARPGP